MEAAADYFGIETAEHADAVRIVNDRYAALAAEGRRTDATSPAALVAFDAKHADPDVYVKSRAKRFGKDVRMED